MLTPRKLQSRPMRRKVKEPSCVHERHPQALKPLSSPPNYARCGAGVAAPKGEPAKPGKRAPNAEERRWMDAIVSHGCIACRIDWLLVPGLDGVYEPRPPQVHHILRGGRRMGHLWTLPLCAGHHMDGYGAPGLIARHPTKARFEQRYGSELELLAILRAEIGAP